MDGWVKLHRKFVNWEWFTDYKTSHLFLYLLLSANHKESNWRGQTVKRGQLITGRKSLSEKTGLSEQSIRTCLDRLKSTNEITIKTTNKNSIITVLNYDLYQNKESDNQQNNQQLTIKQPTSNQQLTTNKNDNNKKNEKKIDINPIQKVLVEAEKSGYNPQVKESYKNFMNVLSRECPIISKMPKQLNIKTYYDLVNQHGKEKLGLELEIMELWLEEKGVKRKDVNAGIKRWLKNGY